MPYKKLHKETIIVQTEIACYQAISVFFDVITGCLGCIQKFWLVIKWWITLYSTIFEYADFFDIEERA